MQSKAEDAGGLSPVKDDNTAMRTLYLRTFARNSDDCYKILKGTSARHLFMFHPDLRKSLWGGHLWNPSYFVATVSDNTTAQIEEYIRSQKTK